MRPVSLIAHDADESWYRSRLRRNEANWERAQHRRRLRLCLLPFLIGVALLTFEVTRDIPAFGLVGLGIVLCVPFLAEATR